MNVRIRNPKGVIAFLILAFAIAWTSWEIPIRMGIPATSGVFQLFALPGAFAPAIAAILVRLFGGEGFADAGLRPHLKRWPYYLFALLLPIAVAGVIVLEVEQFGIGRPDFTMAAAIKAYAGRGFPLHAAGGLGLLIIPQLLVMAIITTPILWGEEFGWRGYLQPRLFPGKPILAALAVGPIWAVWHYPVVLRGYDFGDQAYAGAAVMPVSCTLISFIFAWLVERTGSIWSSSLAHAATNGVGGATTVLWFSGLNKPFLTSYIGVLGLAPLFAVCVAIFFFGRRSAPTVSPAGLANAI